MWILDPQDYEMKYISFHKTKPDRAYKGGEIFGFRDPTMEEYESHQEEMRERGEGQMNSPDDRKIIRWRPIPSWKELWPRGGGSNPMAYRDYGYVPPDDAP